MKVNHLKTRSLISGKARLTSRCSLKIGKAGPRLLHMVPSRHFGLGSCAWSKWLAEWKLSLPYGNLWHHVAPVTPHVCQTTFTRKVQAFHVFCTCDLGPSNLLGPALAARNETNRLLHYVSKNTLRCELVSAPVAAPRAACSSSSVAAPVILRKNKSHTTKKDNEIPGCC